MTTFSRKMMQAGDGEMTTEIILQRQGISRTLRQSFLPCPHGKKWHIEFINYSDAHEVYRAELNYPDCSLCFGSLYGQPAWSNGVRFMNEAGDLALIKLEAIRAIRERVDVTVRFFRMAEAYYCYTDTEYRGYPYLEDDVFLAACYYNVKRDVILLVAKGEGDGVLVTFDKGTGVARACYPPFGSEAFQAIEDYKKDHVQREGSLRAKTWLAWLLSEYIKSGYPDVVVQEMNRMAS